MQAFPFSALGLSVASGFREATTHPRRMQEPCRVLCDRQ